MYTLPAGYTTVRYTGTTYYVVDEEYLKKYYEGDKVVYVVVDDPKKTAVEKTDDQTQPASTETAEQKLLELKNIYDKGLIDKEEYETKKKEILNSM